LEANGYRVVTAADGMQALDVFKRHLRQIRVVIVDMMMPGLDGAATISSLQEQNSKTRIIASSGLKPPAKLPQSIATGEALFLQKPYTDDQLLATVAMACRRDN
jgi:CheY-like chemotaxis protein